MTTYFGYFESPAGDIFDDGSPALARPFIDADITVHEVGFGLGVAHGRVSFLIDSGADRTSLTPDDASRLFGAHYFELNVADDPGLIGLSGVGRGLAPHIVREAELALYRDAGGVGIFELDILIAAPPPPGPDWISPLPSLLGRDILEHLDLHLSYNPPSVSLTVPDL